MFLQLWSSDRVLTVRFAGRRIAAPVSVALTTSLRLTNQHVSRVTCIVDNASEASFGWDHPESSVNDSVLLIQLIAFLFCACSFDNFTVQTPFTGKLGKTPV